MGAMTTTPKSRGFWRSSRNSFQTRNRSRCMSALIPGEPHGGETQHGGRIQREGANLRQQVTDLRAFEDDAAERDEKVPGGHHVRNQLKRARHAADRKDES